LGLKWYNILKRYIINKKTEETKMTNFEELKEMIQAEATEEEGRLTINFKDWEKESKKRVYMTSNSSDIGWFGTENGEFKFYINSVVYKDIAKVKRFKKHLMEYLKTLN
jgi:hypothetical protein